MFGLVFLKSHCLLEAILVPHCSLHVPLDCVHPCACFMKSGNIQMSNCGAQAICM